MVFQDEDYALVSVTLFQKVVDEFKHKVRLIVTMKYIFFSWWLGSHVKNRAYSKFSLVYLLGTRE